MAQSGRMGRYPGAGFERRGRGGGGSGGDQQLHKIGVDAAKLATEQIKGISSQVRSHLLSFQHGSDLTNTAAVTSGAHSW